MKVLQTINLKIAILLGCIFTITSSCERSVSDDVDFAKFGSNPAVFIDGFSGGLEYLPFAGSKLDAFTVDDQTFYQGTASMRFDVPNFGDPAGAFAGAIFPDNGGRDLSGYDALTFWAKATKGATINEIGFGNNFGENKFLIAANNLSVSTGWQKYIIPIPDPSRLTQEKGMFWYSEGPENGEGYTFWIDELQFEKLGTIAQPRPVIFDGVDGSVESFIGSTININGLRQTFNLSNGLNSTVTASPSYFTFESTDNDVARVSELGVITVVGRGTATISASLNGVKAAGSLTLDVGGAFEDAPTPPQDPANVISIFSDTYNSVSGLNIAVFNGPGFPVPNIQIGTIDFNGNSVIEYANLDFVGIGWDGTSDVSAYTHIHIDVQVRQAINPGDGLVVELIDFGPNDSDGGGDDTGGGTIIAGSDLQEASWVGLDIPLNSFTNGTGGGFGGSPNTANVARIVFVGVSGISNILVDNVYFYRE